MTEEKRQQRIAAFFYENEETRFNSGEFIYFTSGAWSEYQVEFCALVLNSFDLRDYAYIDDEENFAIDTQRLINEDVIKELPSREIRTTRFDNGR